jgi:hypothetical protein
MITTTRHRDPDLELYDHACELVEAAAAIRQAVTVPGTDDAVPALLGCVEAALRDLAAAAGELEQRAAAHADDRRRQRAGEGLHHLRVALDDAAVGAHAAQALAARVRR